MRPVTVTVSAADVSTPVVLDYRLTPENSGLQCVVSNGGALTYKVQYSNDDPFAVGFSAASANWFDHQTLNGQTSSQFGSLGFPARMVRLNVTAYTSGSVTMTVVQSGD